MTRSCWLSLLYHLGTSVNFASLSHFDQLGLAFIWVKNKLCFRWKNNHIFCHMNWSNHCVNNFVNILEVSKTKWGWMEHAFLLKRMLISWGSRIYKSSKSQYKESDINFVEDTTFTYNMSTVVADKTQPQEKLIVILERVFL